MKLIKEEAIKQPSLLSRFCVFSFANLKSYLYYYWFAFPAPTFFSCNYLDAPKNIREIFNDEQLQTLHESYNSLLDCHNKGFFFVRLIDDNLEVYTVENGINEVNCDEDWFIGFSDTSNSRYPSWPLRNFIALVSYHW